MVKKADCNALATGLYVGICICVVKFVLVCTLISA